MFLLKRENTKRMKGQVADWDIIFPNHLSNYRLTPDYIMNSIIKR